MSKKNQNRNSSRKDLFRNGKSTPKPKNRNFSHEKKEKVTQTPDAELNQTPTVGNPEGQKKEDIDQNSPLEKSHINSRIKAGKIFGGVFTFITLVAAVIAILDSSYWKNRNNRPDSYNEVLLEAQSMTVEPVDSVQFRIHYNLHNLNDKNIRLLSAGTIALHGPTEDTSYLSMMLFQPKLHNLANQAPRQLDKNADNFFVTENYVTFTNGPVEGIGLDVPVLVGGVCIYLHPDSKDTFRYEYMSRIYKGRTMLLKSNNEPFSSKNLQKLMQQAVDRNNAQHKLVDSLANISQ